MIVDWHSETSPLKFCMNLTNDEIAKARNRTALEAKLAVAMAGLRLLVADAEDEVGESNGRTRR